jgi:hypothetical protein
MTLRERITHRSIPFQTLGVLASRGGSVIFASEVSKWAAEKEPINAAKSARLMDTLVKIEALLDGVKIRPDLRDADVLRAALIEFENHKIKQVDAAPSAIARPSWPAKSQPGMQASHEATKLLAQQ